MVTMKDIADSAGVSTSTVSRVLNGKDRGRIKPEVAKRVREQADRMGYIPNQAARSLRTRTSNILGFVSDEIATTPYAGRIILGAQDAARELGYVMLTVNTGGDAAVERQQVQVIQRYGADGFLYARMYNQLVQVPDVLDGYPVVVVDAEDEKGAYPSITPDEYGIGYKATRRLIDAGRRRIAYVGSNDGIRAQIGRFSGYRQALLDAGLEANDDLVFDMDDADADVKIAEMLDRCRPDGVFCFNDVRASFLYMEALRRHVAVGRDLSVVGVDNQPLITGVLKPRLASVELPHYEMGYWSVYKLVSLVKGHRVGFPDSAPASTLLRARLPSLDETRATVDCVLVDGDSAS